MEQKKSDKSGPGTFSQRYFYKLGSNVITILAGICTSAIVPRSLGVAAYGNFSFATNVITQALNAFDLRASTGFYVKLTQRRSESKIITFYSIFTLLVFGILALTTGLVLLPSEGQLLFEGISSDVVWLSLALVCAKWIVDTFIRISDAYGTTGQVERIKIFVFAFATLALLALFWLNLINITTFFIHQIALFTLLFLLIRLYMIRNRHPMPLTPVMDSVALKNYAREFYVYSAPLAIYMMTTLVSEVFDRYILQHYGGSFQQGLYGFSFSISNILVLFVTAMVPLFTRELSIAFSIDDKQAAAALYRKYVPLMYVVSAYFCAFLFVNAEDVLLLFGGKEFLAALVPLQIMLIHPLASTYSNLNGSVVYAASGNVLFRNMALVLHPLGMVASFFLISENFLHLGAFGLSIKVVSIEIVSVCVVMWYVSGKLNIKPWKYYAHMVVVPLTLALVAYIIREAGNYTVGENLGPFMHFMVSGLVYTMVLFLIIYFYPIFVGLSRESIHDAKRVLLEKLK